MRETLEGVELVVFLNKLKEEGPEGIRKALEKLREISTFVGKSALPTKAAVNAKAEAFGVNEKALQALAAGLELKSDKAVVDAEPFQPTYTNTMIPLPFTINHTARAFLGVPYTHKDGASLEILAELMTHRFLHREVREIGGAYGAFARYSAMGGVFSMVSYRDPPGAGVRTMGAYDRAETWAADVVKNVSERELNEAKLSVLSKTDAPLSPDQEGMARYYYGLTDEMLQAYVDDNSLMCE
ncbi:Mitochondrial presequence protease [Irineochytrium annulatum]|nr:Mitochondrial presequence protease [Irineochytrium annulatum]